MAAIPLADHSGARAQVGLLCARLLGLVAAAWAVARAAWDALATMLRGKENRH
jgi:hypothetical protein